MIKMFRFRDKLRTHFLYSWWQYFLLIVGGFLLITLLYDLTDFAAPDEKNITLQVVGPYINDDFRAKYEEGALEKFKDRGVEEVHIENLSTGSDKDPQIFEFLSALILTGANDAYILPKDTVLEFATSDTFLRLEAYVEEGGVLSGLYPTQVLENEKISFSVRRHKQFVEVEDALVALPLTSAYGFLISDDANFADCYLVINAYSANLDVVVDFVRWFLEGQFVEKPDWYDGFIADMDHKKV